MSKRSRSNRGRSVGRTSSRAGAGKPPGGREWLVDAIIGVALVLLVAVAYVQVLRFPFVNYDDKTCVPNNPQVREGISLGGMGWAFTAFETGNWHPLTWLSLMLDCQMFGPWPGGHHAVNAVLHAANAVLLFVVLRTMTGSALAERTGGRGLRRASAARRIGGLDCRAEGRVVWAVLSADALGLFAYAASPRFGRWILVFLGMALGLMAKSMLVTLPALLLLDYWPLRRMAGSRERRAGSRERGAGSGEPGAGSRERGARSRERGAVNELLAGKLETRDLKSEICDLKSEIGLPPSAFPPSSFPLPPSFRKAAAPVLSLAIAAVTLAAQASKGTTTMLYGRADLPVRLANAAIASVKYLGMIVWPAHLAVYYPYDFQPPLGQTIAAAHRSWP